MKYDVNKLKSWLPQKEAQLPGLTSLLTNSKADILIIGAAVFELYELQGWLPPFKRKTGDIDLSVGLINDDDDDYQAAKQILLDHKYKLDEEHPYRYHSPKKIPGGYTYIDLLAHPSKGGKDKHLAAGAIGVGPGFSFNGFHFAERESYKMFGKVIFPNPFGLMALKRESYLDEPAKRLKDFADIVELIGGLVEKGVHFEIGDLWAKLKSQPEAKDIKSMILSIADENHSGAWDIDNVRRELIQRDFNNDFIDGDLMQRIRDFRDEME